MQHSTTHPRITVIPRQPVFNKSILGIAIAAFGILNVLVGVIGLVSVIIPFLSTSILTLAGTTLSNALFDLFLGAVILGSFRAFTQGRPAAIWLYVASLAIDLLYKLVMGYPVNYVFIGFGVLLIWQLLKLRAQWETS
jgi:hypothetical protein